MLLQCSRPVKRGGRLAATLLLGLLALGSAVATPGRAEDLLGYGRHLAQECAACHRLDGVDNGIPAITGWDADRLVATLEFYRSGARGNPAMVSVANSLDADQMRALAAYLATLPKGPPAKK